MIPFHAFALAALLSAAPESANPMLDTPAAEDNPYTVIWDSPSQDASGSMPLGNGDAGVNFWVEPDGTIAFYLSKTDAWSGNGRLLKLGRVRVRFEPNPFAGAADFRQTLDVRTGAVEVSARTEDGEFTLRAWADANYPVIRLEAQAPAPVTMEARLDPWRTQSRELHPGELHSAYGLINAPDPVVVAADTIADEDPSAVVWYHRNEKSIWGDTLRLQGMAEWLEHGEDPLLHRTFGGYMKGDGLRRKGMDTLVSKAAADKHSLCVYVLTRQCGDASEWLREAAALAENDAYERSPGESWREHAEWWRAFWNRSWVHVSGPGLEHVTRGYTLQRFIAACAGRGDYPIKFNGSIFTVDARVDGHVFDADYRRWGGPYWFQNTRLAYWPMLAAGDFGMMQPLFGMYLDALPFAKARTEVYFGHGGAFFPETMYFWGAFAQDNYGWDRGDLPVGVTENTYIRRYWSGALELTLMALDHYAHTQDDEFARNRLLPLADAVLTFYFEHYPRDKQGKLLLKPSQSLETWHETANPLPPIAGMRAVLPKLLELPEPLADKQDRTQWARMLEAVPELPVRDTEHGPMLAPAEELLSGVSNSENPGLYAVFPYRLYGVGKPDLGLARRTFAHRRVKGNTGWRQDDTQAAYLGLADQAAALLTDRLKKKHEGSRFPAFWGPNFDWIPDQDHGSNALKALQTMLLQHNGQELLLLPAWPKEWNVSFRLHAPGRTLVEGEYAGGDMKRLEVTPLSRREDVKVLEPR